jgi:hypothetical protein
VGGVPLSSCGIVDDAASPSSLSAVFAPLPSCGSTVVEPAQTRRAKFPILRIVTPPPGESRSSAQAVKAKLPLDQVPRWFDVIEKRGNFIQLLVLIHM